MAIVFYDSLCPLCDKSLRFLITQDKHHVLYFAPLGGKTFEKEVLPYLNNTKGENSLILMEKQGVFFFRAQAVLRLASILGGKWALIGWLSYFPWICFCLDPIYRLVARYRYVIISQKDGEEFLNKEQIKRFLN